MIIVARWYLQHDDRQIKRSPYRCTFKFLNRHNCESTGKTMEEGVAVWSLVRNILRVEGCVGISGWGLR